MRCLRRDTPNVYALPDVLYRFRRNRGVRKKMEKSEKVREKSKDKDKESKRESKSSSGKQNRRSAHRRGG